jgi:hypothetical protein
MLVRPSLRIGEPFSVTVTFPLPPYVTDIVCCTARPAVGVGRFGATGGGTAGGRDEGGFLHFAAHCAFVTPFPRTERSQVWAVVLQTYPGWHCPLGSAQSYLQSAGPLPTGSDALHGSQPVFVHLLDTLLHDAWHVAFDCLPQTRTHCDFRTAVALVHPNPTAGSRGHSAVSNAGGCAHPRALPYWFHRLQPQFGHNPPFRST